MFDFVSFFPRAVMQGIPLLFGSTGEILTEKSGNLNLGIPGIMYVGGISGVIGAFFYEQATKGSTMNGFLAIMIPILCSLLGSLLMGLLYCFLTVTLRANQNVTGLAMTTFGVGVGNFFGGSLIKLTGSEVPSIALSNTSLFFKVGLPGGSAGWFGQLFLSYGFLAYVAIIIALGASYFLNHTRPGLHLRAVGESASTADAAGIKVARVIIRTMVLSGALCALMGFLLTSGVDHTLTTTIVDSRGFTAVMVSWMSTFNPFIMIASSLLLVTMDRGASEVASALSLNHSFADILTGIILFFIIATEFFITYKVTLRKSSKKEA